MAGYLVPGVDLALERGDELAPLFSETGENQEGPLNRAAEVFWGTLHFSSLETLPSARPNGSGKRFQPFRYSGRHLSSMKTLLNVEHIHKMIPVIKRSGGFFVSFVPGKTYLLPLGMLVFFRRHDLRGVKPFLPEEVSFYEDMITL